jgi:flagellar basal-body rod protein FlgB
MNNLLDKALGLHPHAVNIGAKRLETLAANMANADTPGYKARDIDFRSALAAVSGDNNSVVMRASHQSHFNAAGQDLAMQTKYRTPNHPSLDGNTVDGQLEQAAFADAAVRYQASLDFLTGRIEGLRKALRGE